MTTAPANYRQRKTHGGTRQLRKLEDRMTDKQFERRTQKMVTRVGMAHAQTRGMVNSVIGVLTRGFIGRLKWVFLGR